MPLTVSKMTWDAQNSLKDDSLLTSLHDDVGLVWVSVVHHEAKVSVPLMVSVAQHLK